MKFKWSMIAKLVLPIVAATVPGADKVVPYIEEGIDQVDDFRATDTKEQKAAHVEHVVRAGVDSLNATGKVSIDPTDAIQITRDAIDVVDRVHAMKKAAESPK